jgi:hypothetical protein
MLSSIDRQIRHIQWSPSRWNNRRHPIITPAETAAIRGIRSS